MNEYETDMTTYMINYLSFHYACHPTRRNFHVLQVQVEEAIKFIEKSRTFINDKGICIFEDKLILNSRRK